MDKSRILIVEDDDLQYEIYEDALAAYELVRTRSMSSAMSLLHKQPPNVIILDHILAKGERGLEFLPQLKELLPYVPIIVVSGVLEVREQMQALQGPRRAHYCIAKPVDVIELQRTVETALKECGEAEVIRRYEALERSRRVDAEALISRSAERLSRQTEILSLVKQTPGRPNVSALARQFRVARRTIIRDLQELMRRGQLPPDVFPKWDEAEDEE